MKDIEILVITKGHPFLRDPFFAIFDDMAGVNYTHVEQPAAQVFADPDLAEPYDAFVFYDMPGIDFVDNKLAGYIEPAPAFKKNFLALLAQGKGMVFLHHAIAGWPTWPQYGEIVGGRFLYAPAKVRGRDCPDSGYRHGVTHQVTKRADHPVTRDIPAHFTMTDELYLAEIFEDSVTPLLASNFDFSAANFYSADHAVRLGKMFDNEGWQHPKGSNLVGWVKHYGQSPLVYLQGGDGPETYGNENYRRLVANAINWVTSKEAHDWARAQNKSSFRGEKP